MEKASNKAIAAVLKEIALYKELGGENTFKVRAFEGAARTVEIHPEEITKLCREGGLEDIRGIGKSVAEAIREYVDTGKSAGLERLRSSFPPTIGGLFAIQGMGPKKIKAVWDQLGVSSVGELEYACKENRLVTLDGFGQKSQEKILKAIEFVKLHADRRLYSEALGVAEEVSAALDELDLSIAGSLRRGKSTFKDIDILVVSDEKTDAEKLRSLLLSLADEDGVIASGTTKVSVRRRGLQIDFRIVEKRSFPTALQHFTGSKEHNTILRSRAKRMGLKLNEYGVFKGDDSLEVKDEGDVYMALGLQYIPPEIREGEEEVDASEQKRLPKLVSSGDLHGMIHVHSSYSDGANSIEELATACRSLGYSYLCISDHSRTAFYAHGLSVESIRSQIEETKRINEKHSPFRVFCGIESDILSDGGLDYPDDVLAELDFVIGSVHSKLSMKSEEATERLLGAIHNPYLTILGHMSGRLLLSREGYGFDEDGILEALRENGVVIEHNCNPHRLDPDWPFMKRAKKMGVLVSVNPDAHSIEGFSDMRYGVVMARKAWLEKQDVLNCMTVEEIDEFFNGRKKKKGV